MVVVNVVTTVDAKLSGIPLNLETQQRATLHISFHVDPVLTIK